ncbi:hypothetical protein [Desulfopila inferna]|uniref:hypothetical protein n=1 Tax=Desulfopila inferna TaxID=468528 RepID=UPI0019655E7A|nr:hypothetical protein [Desulfopila inferna]MBM9604003.1 hypothetical protein [Desulfopila inferna]
MVDTVGIGGIKLSGKLIQVDFLERKTPGEKLIRFLRRIASAKISIPHLHQGEAGKAMQTTICIGAEDFQGLQADTDAETPEGWSRILPSVGTISLFPHGHDLSLCSRAISALAQKNIPLYGISSSVSTLVIHTDYSLLDSAAEALLTVCRLPKNHTPLRPVVLLDGEAVETVAVYWEPKIRIYGMEIIKDLISVQLDCPAAVLQGDCRHEFRALKGKFRQVALQTGPQDRVTCVFLVEPGGRDQICAGLEKIAECQPGSHLAVGVGRELISFHGPHFHDRYGIAGLTFSTLMKNGITALASGCTGTSVHLVVAAGMSEHVEKCLKEICIIPQ